MIWERFFQRTVWFRATFFAAALIAVCCSHAADLGYYPIHLEGEIASRPGHAAPGSNVVFAPGFSEGSTPPPGSYQWFRNGAPIPGASSSSLTLRSVTSADNAIYTFENLNAGALLKGNPFTLNVTTPPPSPIDPTFTSRFPVNYAFRSLPEVLVGASDGSLLIQDFAYDSTVSATVYRAVRLRSDGSFDANFSYAGPGNRIVAVLPDGGFITAFAPYRFKADGSPSALSLPVGFGDYGLSAAVGQPDGKFIIGQDYPVKLARLNADGSLDATFQFDAPAGLRNILRLRLDQKARFLLVANVDVWTLGDGNLLMRLGSTGREDTSFTRVRNVSDAVPLADGGLLMTASTYSYDSALVCLNENGTRADGFVDFTPLYGSAQDRLVHPSGWVFMRATNGIVRRYTIAKDRITLDPGFYPGPDPITAMWLDPSGWLIVLPTSGYIQGRPAVLLRLRESDNVPPYAPIVSVAAQQNDYAIWNAGPHGIQGAMPSAGDVVRINSTVTANTPVTYQWLALDGQAVPPDTTSPTLLIPGNPAYFGRFQLRVTGFGGATWSDPVFVSYPLQQPFLANLSGRALTGTGENAVIAGLVTATTFHGLLRGAGPALKDFGVTNFLPNPAIDVYNSSGQVVTNNGDWGQLGNGSELSSYAQRAGAFDFRVGSLDAAAISRFQRGSYTVRLFDQAGNSGVSLVEIYTDLKPPATGNIDHYINLSFRARTEPGEGTAIAGFVLTDAQGYGRPTKVLLRAIGPTLSTSGIAHPLENPVLTVYNAKGEIVARNDDWATANTSGDAAALSAAMKTVGAFDLAPASTDAALLLNLPAGAYSMHATGGTGVVLLEVYLVRPE